MAKLEKNNLYLLSIVGIVAIVGVVVLVLNSQTNSIERDFFTTGEDFTGESVSSAQCGMTCDYNCKKQGGFCNIISDQDGVCYYSCKPIIQTSS